MRNTGILGTIGWLLLSLTACSTESDQKPAPMGAGASGSPSTGGSTGSGGASPTGGSVSGGRAATGGGPGKVGTGGTPSGGTSSAGSPGSGGSGPTTGGATAGGATAGGATSGGATTGGSGGSATTGGATTGGAGGGAAGGTGTTEKFSFFVTSLGGMRRLSGKEEGFGGDLRFGEATGLEGADKICATLAESSLPGAGQKTWRAFLSTTTVDAVDRIGDGPWYDRLGRLLAQNKADLIQTRPAGGDAAIANDLPNEEGTPNHLDGSPGCTGNGCPDNHDTLTASNADGTWDGKSTCDDWTNTEAEGQPRAGHSWPAQSGMSWIQAHAVGGCQAGVNLVQGGGMIGGTVGALGGYGGLYCFALTP